MVLVKGPIPGALLLFLVTTAVFWPALKGLFIFWDDNYYVIHNAHVNTGLSAANFAWGLHSLEHSNWHPLTWWSHMLDCQLYGLSPWGHHLSNLLLHAANAALLFLVLRQITGAHWRSFIVAALFGLHPLRVESVVAISQRKDVLAGLFWMLTIAAYAQYARSASALSPTATQPSAPAQPPDAPRRPWFWYAVALVCFALGLMSKTTMVTLPFVLWLLDYWPLGRWRPRAETTALAPSRARVVLEKAPFLAMSVAVSTVTYLAQKDAGRMDVLKGLTFFDRVSNGLVSYARYLGKLFWPAQLSAFYPHPIHWPAMAVIAAGLLVVGVTVAVLALRRRRPYLLVGWFWYLGVLVPMLGLVQVDAQSMADRYTYLPSIGALVGLVWGLAEVAQMSRPRLTLLATAAAAAVIACALGTYHQIGYWKDTVTLFRHAAEVTKDNYVPCWCLGHLFVWSQQPEKARVQYEQCVRLRPDSAQARNELGNAYNGLGRLREAIVQLQKAVELDPNLPEARCNLGVALAAQGHRAEAIASYREALRLNPDLTDALNNLAWLLATDSEQANRNGPEAVRLAEHACVITHYQQPGLLGTLAAAYAEVGRFDDAVTMGERATALWSALGDSSLAQANEKLLTLYRGHQPCRGQAGSKRE